MIQLIPLALAQDFPIYPELPARTNYKQIETEMFRLIYPESTSRMAFELADMFAHYTSTASGHSQPNFGATLHGDIKRFMASAPRRSLSSSCPYEHRPLKMGTSLSWNSALRSGNATCRRTRPRYNASRGHMINGASWAGGYQSISQTIWFAEGGCHDSDIAFASRERRNIWVYWQQYCPYDQGQPFSYPQSVFGSYKTNIPDHYRIGWIMTDHGFDRWLLGLNLQKATADALRPIHLKTIYKTTGSIKSGTARYPVRHHRMKGAMANQRPSGLELVYEDPSPFPLVNAIWAVTSRAARSN